MTIEIAIIYNYLLIILIENFNTHIYEILCIDLQYKIFIEFLVKPLFVYSELFVLQALSYYCHIPVQKI